MSPERAFEVVNGYASPIYHEAMRDLSPDGQAIANSFHLKILQDQITNKQIDTFIRDSQQDFNIQDNAKKIIDVSAALSDFKKKIESRIDKLSSTQGKLIGTVQELDARVFANSKAITALQSITFERLSPKQ
jgi:hypothetical protein